MDSSTSLTNRMRPPEWDRANWSVHLNTYYHELTLVARNAIRLVTRAKLDPEDIVQQTFYLAFVNRDQFRGSTQAEFGCWIRTILASELSRVIRYYHETQARNREVLWENLSHTDTGTSPSQQAARQENRSSIQAALKRLPADYRFVLVCREQDGLSFVEIATRIGRTENAVRKLWARALLALRHQMEPTHGVAPTN